MLLRGVEIRLITRNIFLCILQIGFICPYYSEMKNKEVEKRRQAYPFSLSMICMIVHEGKGEKEKKKKRDSKDWTCKSTPFPYLPGAIQEKLRDLRASPPEENVTKKQISEIGLLFVALIYIQAESSLTKEKKNERR